MMPDRSVLTTMHRHVLGWYRRAGRVLPWRGRFDPYEVLVSEIMLQQTQVQRVLVKYPEFLSAFPTIKRLATAPQKEVVTAWRGMGYNNRAVRLHRLAKSVVKRHRQDWPSDLPGLLALPGVGIYTAHAMMAFAFRQRVPVVDINIRRVLSRVFWRMKDTGSMRTEREIRDIAGAILPARNVYDWNQALMDLGSLVCTARSPDCNACPIARECLSARRMQPRPQRHPSREPSRGGIPNRTYRGKIIDALRSRRTGIGLARLGPMIMPDFSRRDLPWLHALIDALETDGLVRVTLRHNLSPVVSLA